MTPGGKRVVLVAAVARNGVIGNGPEIPWRIKGEQALFKELTTGHVLLMGRATYDTIGRPLPGRTTIVLTRDRAWAADGVLVAHDLDEALRLADTLEGDVFYPATDPAEWTETLREPHEGYDRVFLTREI